MQRCPNCGAYVMSSDNYCPRCDHPLDQPAPDEREFEAVAEIFDPNASPADSAAGLVIPEFRRSAEPAEARLETVESEDSLDHVEQTFTEEPLDLVESGEEAAEVEGLAPADAWEASLPIVEDEIRDGEASEAKAEAEADELAGLDEEAETEAEAEARAQLPTTRLPNALAVFKSLLPAAKAHDTPAEEIGAEVEAPPIESAGVCARTGS